MFGSAKVITAEHSEGEKATTEKNERGKKKKKKGKKQKMRRRNHRQEQSQEAWRAYEERNSETHQKGSKNPSGRKFIKNERKCEK